MGATMYQVLYRYINESTNAVITNSMDNEYETVREFYSDPDHKIFSEDKSVQAEAMDEQQEMISFGNNSSNPKTNMLFAYDGTKKIKHKKWIEEATGYAVRDWKQLKRSSIGNQNDFTKEFTTINAASPEDGGLVVCTKDVMEKYFPKETITVVSDNTLADSGIASNRYYAEETINKMITESTLFALDTSGYGDHGQPSKTSSLKDAYGRVAATYFSGPVAIGKNDMATYTNRYSSAYGSPSSDGLYSSITVTRKQIKTVIIPGHYEESVEAPYLIADTYKRIQLSPWFVNCTCGSLEAAITKAKALVDMIGIENVKIIKTVSVDQFVKIK